MIRSIIALLAAIIASNEPATPRDPITGTNSTAAATTNAVDLVEQEFKKLEENDDAAQEEVDEWIRQNMEFEARGGGIPRSELSRRIRRRFEPIGKAYADFIQQHPNHAKARIAYAAYLDDIGDEDAEIVQLEKAREIDPTDPAVWNQLANYYGHNGPTTNAFAYYEKAIALDPHEPVYFHNFGTTVYLFRKDAREFYHIEEQQVFDKALGLYSNALVLDPTNFSLASDVAQTYYGIRPLRTNDALLAWTNTLKLAGDEVEREGVYVHLARMKMAAGFFDQAQAHLNAVTNEVYDDLKHRLQRNLIERRSGTNPPPSVTTNAPAPNKGLSAAD